MTNLKRIELQKSETTGVYSLIIQFTNSRFQQLNIRPEYTSKQVALSLHELAESIINDDKLNN